MSHVLLGGHSGGCLRETFIYIPPRNDPTELSNLILVGLSLRGVLTPSSRATPPRNDPLVENTTRWTGVAA